MLSDPCRLSVDHVVPQSALNVRPNVRRWNGLTSCGCFIQIIATPWSWATHEYSSAQRMSDVPGSRRTLGPTFGVCALALHNAAPATTVAEMNFTVAPPYRERRCRRWAKKHGMSSAGQAAGAGTPPS